MKSERMLTILVLAFCLMVYSAQLCQAQPTSMGTTFTYQGHLYDSNYVANDLYNFLFRLYNDPDPNIGLQVGDDVDIYDVNVIDGYFTVELDFSSDPNAFNGDARWLEIGVNPSDTNGFTTLTPRQEVTPTPYAFHAKTAGSVAGTIGGSGTANYIPKFTGATTLGDSVIYESGSNLGIGTTTPATKLHVYEPSSSDVFVFVEANSSNAEAGVRLANPAGGWDVFSNNNDGDFGIAHALSDRVLTITRTTGDVGIGTTAPATELEVVGTITATGGNSNNWNTAHSWGNHALAGYLKAETDPQVGGNSNNYVPKWDGSALVTGTIYDNGDVGIGTMSPDAKLHVYNYSGTQLKVGNSNQSALEWYLDVDGFASLKITNENNGSPTTAMHLTSSGDVGIGTTSPQNQLDVEGAMAIGTSYSGTSTAPSNGVIIQGNVGIGITNPDSQLHIQSSTGNQLKLGHDSHPDHDWYMNADEATFLQICNENDGSPTVAMHLTSYDGNVGIGTTDPARKLHVSDVMRLQPRASAPSTPSAGDIYFDSTDNKLKVYDGTTWQSCW